MNLVRSYGEKSILGIFPNVHDRTPIYERVPHSLRLHLHLTYTSEIERITNDWFQLVHLGFRVSDPQPHNRPHLKERGPTRPTSSSGWPSATPLPSVFVCVPPATPISVSTCIIVLFNPRNWLLIVVVLWATGCPLAFRSTTWGSITTDLTLGLRGRWDVTSCCNKIPSCSTSGRDSWQENTYMTTWVPHCSQTGIPEWRLGEVP